MQKLTGKDISDRNVLTQAFQKYQPDIVINRDFTYIDDIIEGVERIIVQPPTGDVPYRIFNIGNNKPESLTVFIRVS